MSDDSGLTRIPPAVLEVQDPDELHLIVESTPDDDPSKPLLLHFLANKFLSRFEDRGDVRDIDHAIASCRLGVNLSVHAPIGLARAHRALWIVCMARFERLHDPADLEEATVSSRRVLEFTPDDDPQYILEYGYCFLSRLALHDDIDTLREACTWFCVAVELLHDADDAKPSALATLGGLLTACFLNHPGTADDIHEAIIVLVRAVELMPSSDLERSTCIRLLTTALSRRFGMQELEDLGPLAQYHFAVNILPQEYRHRFFPLLAMSFRARSAHNLAQGDHEQAIIDIDTAIALQRRVLEHTTHYGLPDADTKGNTLPFPPRSDFVDLLASTLLKRLLVPGNVTTFYRHMSTVDLIPEAHPQKPLLLTALAESFRMRFERDRDPNDFDGSVIAAQHALRLEPDSVSAMRCLGCALVARFVFDKQASSATDDLDEAIPLLQCAVDSRGDPDRLDNHAMFKLASALLMRFERVGDAAASDIDRAIALLQSAISQFPDGHKAMQSFWDRLADLFRVRFLRYRKARDVEEAIHAATRARDLSPSSAPQRSQYAAKLSELFTLRRQHFHHVEDWYSAVEALRDVASSNSDPHLLMHLAIQLSDIHATESDLDEAVDLMRNLIERDPQDAALPGYLAVLGVVLTTRFQCRGVVDDLEEAVTLSERSLFLSADSGDKGIDFTASLSLARCYISRFHILHHAPDLDKGIDLMRHSLEHIPSWLVTSEVLMLFIEKLILRLRTNPSPQVDHLRDAREQAQRAIDAGGGPSSVVEAALHFTGLVEWEGLLPQNERQRLLEDVTVAYGRMILLIPQAAWLGDDIDRRLERLSSYSERNIVGAAVAHALAMNNISSALEWFEQGRAVVWTQINGLRTPVDELRSQYPEIASRLEQTAQALENAGRRSASHSHNHGGSSRASTGAAGRHADDTLIASLIDIGSAMFEGDESRARRQVMVEEHRRLAANYIELLGDIRRRPGFEKFLLARSRDELSLAAAQGPVACINMHSSRCDALILCDSDLHHVPLPDLTPEIAEEWQQTLYECLGLDCARDRKSKSVRTASNDGVVGVLKRMWVVVVQPIFAVLGWTDGSSIKDRRIRWCTRSSLAFLPLHAAGLYDGSSLNASDIAVSSYTSTLAALLPEARGSTPTAPEPPSILMLAQPNASGASPLPGTMQEFKHVQQHFSATSSSTFLLGPQGTSAAVLENMSKHPYIHLACHGRQGVADPMSSSFLLADGDLTLHTLMEKSLRTGELAFLSACETSKGHENMPDEAVHLAAGMLAVGYRSVVGTMWSISDSAAPLVANEFYKALLDPKLPTVDGRPDVAYALHVATGVLRDAILKEQLAKEKVDDVAFAKWVPFVHFGL